MRWFIVTEVLQAQAATDQRSPVPVIQPRQPREEQESESEPGAELPHVGRRPDANGIGWVDLAEHRRTFDDSSSGRLS